MALDLDAVRAGLPASVPMVATLSLEFVELEHTRALMRLPDQPAYRNHVGGPHAGAMFTLAESASGALVLANFGDRLAEATPLAVEATIRYLRLARGDVLAEAVLSRPAEDVLAELAAGRRPEFTVDVKLRSADGTPTGRMTVLWTLKPNAPAGVAPAGPGAGPGAGAAASDAADGPAAPPGAAYAGPGVAEPRGQAAEPSAEQVRGRSDLLPEELAVGSDDPAAQAAAILAESEERVADPGGTAVERRSSADTV